MINDIICLILKIDLFYLSNVKILRAKGYTKKFYHKPKNEALFSHSKK